jgi:hypothetical protein
LEPCSHTAIKPSLVPATETPVPNELSEEICTAGPGEREEEKSNTGRNNNQTLCIKTS